MAGTCSECGKRLTFRDSFEWEKRPLCKACLDARTGEPKTGKAKRPEVQAVTHEGLRRELTKWGAGLIVLGLIHFMAKGFLSPVWGVVLVLQGVLNLAMPRTWMLAVNGTSLLLVAVMNIATSLSGGAGRWIAYGVFQIVWGVQEWLRYFVYRKELGAARPEPAPSAAGAESAGIGRLFNRRAQGPPLGFASAWLAADILMTFTWIPFQMLFHPDRGIGGMAAAYYPILLFLTLLRIAAFFFIGGTVRGVHAAALAAGVAWSAVGLLRRLAMTAFIPGYSLSNVFSAVPLLLGFAGGLLFYYAVFWAMKTSRPSPARFIPAFVTLEFALLVFRTVVQAVSANRPSFDWADPAQALFDGILSGVLLVMGLGFDLKRRRGAAKS